MQTLNGLQYLAVDISNCVGLDKESWDTRIQWVKDNLDKLEELVPSDPKTKYLYIKAVKALRDTQAGLPTGHMCALDASCSGVQLMAVLGKCATSAKTCNLIFTGNREDTYTQIMQHIQGVNISRQDVKEATIPCLYGSKAAPRELFGEDTKELKAFNKAIQETIPVLADMKGLCDHFWNPEAEYHRWTMPDGHEVIIPSEVMKSMRVEIAGTSFTYQYRVVEPHANPTQLLSAIVHSTDAYVAREMVRRAHTQGFQLVHIHDEFRFSPVYGNQVRQNYLDILREIAASDLLEDILSQISNSEVKLEFSDPDLADLMADAEYALS
jgi:DNA-directed RNA polymerase